MGNENTLQETCNRAVVWTLTRDSETQDRRSYSWISAPIRYLRCVRRIRRQSTKMAMLVIRSICGVINKDRNDYTAKKYTFNNRVVQMNVRYLDEKGRFAIKYLRFE